MIFLCIDRNKKNRINTIPFAMKMNKYFNMILFHSINRTFNSSINNIFYENIVKRILPSF